MSAGIIRSAEAENEGASAVWERSLRARLGAASNLRESRLAPKGPRVVFGFTIVRGKVVAIDLVSDPERLRELDLAFLHDG